MTSIDGPESEWKVCFSTENVDLPTGYYFGVSAATGDLAGIFMNSEPWLLCFHEL